jgi:bacterial/archaeal transporter family-2 protein
MSVALLAAIVAGTLIAAQSALIGVFGQQVHPFVAATWIHLAGLAFGVAGVLLSGLGFEVVAVRRAPLGLLAGVAGMLLVTAIAVSVAGVGLVSTLAVVTATQLLVGFVLEATGVFGRVVAVDPIRVGGAVLIVAGVVLVVGRGASGGPA